MGGGNAPFVVCQPPLKNTKEESDILGSPGETFHEYGVRTGGVRVVSGSRRFSEEVGRQFRLTTKATNSQELQV